MSGRIRSGRFADGRLIRTSDILRIELEGEFWVLHTYTGSFYVIASFHPGGYQSLVDYQIFFLRASIRRLIDSTDTIQKAAKLRHEDHNAAFCSTSGNISTAHKMWARYLRHVCRVA